MAYIGKLIFGAILFIAMTYVAFNVTVIFGIMFLIGGLIFIFLYDESFERPGVPILWLMGGLVSRAALSTMLLPILKSETIIDFIVLAVAFLMVYLVGYKIKNN
jgi:hypothetical protein